MSTASGGPLGHAPKKLGLLPLEFADCLLDSPYFRENLRAHEKQLDQTSADIKGIIKDVQVSHENVEKRCFRELAMRKRPLFL